MAAAAAPLRLAAVSVVASCWPLGKLATLKPHPAILGDTILTPPFNPSNRSFGGDQSGLPDNLRGYDKVEQTTNVSNNATIGITFAKVFVPETLAVVVYLKNNGQRALSGVVTQLNIEQLQLVSTDGHAPSGTLTDSIAPGQTVRHVILFGCASPTAAMSVKGQVSFTDVDMSSRSAYFSISVQAGDVLRPMVRTTEQFGAAWESLAQERKQRIASSNIQTSQQFIDRCSAGLHVHPVQVRQPNTPLPLTIYISIYILLEFV